MADNLIAVGPWVRFYWSPLLVESNSDHPVHYRLPNRVNRAGSIAKHARRWGDANVLVSWLLEVRIDQISLKFTHFGQDRNETEMIKKSRPK